MIPLAHVRVLPRFRQRAAFLVDRQGLKMRAQGRGDIGRIRKIGAEQVGDRDRDGWGVRGPDQQQAVPIQLDPPLQRAAVERLNRGSLGRKRRKHQQQRQGVPH